jgi:hypothetical protein
VGKWNDFLGRILYFMVKFISFHFYGPKFHMVLIRFKILILLLL